MGCDTVEAAAACLGEELVKARRSRKLSQRSLAAKVGMSRMTVANLEAGRGTVAALVMVLDALAHRFTKQPADFQLGPWLAHTRKRLGLSQERLSIQAGVSRPAIIRIERGEGTIATMSAAMVVLGLSQLLKRSRDDLRRNFIEGDCVEVMQTMPAGSINLVVTSPPYNFQKEYESKLRLEEYESSVKRWFSELPRILAEDGAAWINVGYTTPTTKTTLPLTYLYYPILREIGLHLIQEVVWRYSGGMAAKHRFSPRSERWQWWVEKPEKVQFQSGRRPRAAYRPRPAKQSAGQEPWLRLGLQYRCGRTRRFHREDRASLSVSSCHG